MEVHASLRRLQMSPRKVRLVVDTVRGLPIQEAEVRLTFLQKAAATPILKLLKSATANAEHNFKLDPRTLVIKKISADDGPTLKRWRPRAFGRAAPIRKRTTHVSITLAPKEGSSKAEDRSPKKEEKKTTTEKENKAKKLESSKLSAKKTTSK